MSPTDLAEHYRKLTDKHDRDLYDGDRNAPGLTIRMAQQEDKMEAVIEQQVRSDKVTEQTALHVSEMKGMFRAVAWMVGTILVVIGLFFGYLTYRSEKSHAFLLSSDPTWTASLEAK